MEKYNELVKIALSMKDDLEKVYAKGSNGGKHASVRVRAALQDIKTLAQELRFEISATVRPLQAALKAEKAKENPDPEIIEHLKEQITIHEDHFKYKTKEQ
jgi:hypothetical protein